ncbi:hypothetical protein FOPG_18291 [Fusarium oxysporum f. sp. conglutinans race 2 54008]|uniref:Uncharacterized protein n=1 Tax=Fusarium oxysporum f. sp. conglutinans race 2 54008 TaxID=1089457 RepID=X0H067_FUSOX|nr:hypothetical protein FOPG_18291 [Fusarium oxysporum f. sp. conglutinans race 2 54008]
MRRHQSSPPEGCSSGVSHTRSRRRRDLDQQFECVYLQTWTTGSTRKYWIIKRGGSIVRQVDNPAVQAHLRGVLTREFSRQQPNPDTMTTTAPAPSAGTTAFALQTPWLDRTGWDRTYSNKGQREVLAALTRTCTSPGGQEYFVGSGKVYGLEDDIVSPGEDEDRIACLVRLVDVVMSRCEETARKTSRHILCWLRSNQASSIYGKPFTLVQSSSTSKYWLLLKRCLAMVCRIYRLHPDRRIKVAGLALSRKQLQFLDAIWTHEALGDLAALNELIGRHKCQVDHAQEVAGGHRESHSEDTNAEEEEEEESEKEEEEGEEKERRRRRSGFTAWLEDLGEITEEEDDYVQEEADAARGSPEELVELLFGLTLAIATQPVINGQPQTTVLIYFSGILGFSSSPGGGAFLPARPYTSNLSGLVYILRLVLLEYALPLRAYPTLALQRRPRMGQLKRLQPVRRQYMVMESQSPMEELLSLRNYGQVISRSDTPAYLLRWSANGQAVSFGDKISISMGQFRRLPEHFIKEAARLCNEMMFSWDPVINLSNITDDMTNNKEGFSFVLHPKNKLDTAYLELLHRTSRAHRNSLVHGGNWDWNAIFQYFKRDEALLSAILGGMFCTGGQLPRCTEVLSLLCCNGELQPREAASLDHQLYDDDSWSYRPLFGIPSEITTNNAMQQHIAILDRLNSRAGFSDDKNLLRAKCKLWELGRTLEHWTQIGCQLCYVRGDMGLDHQLDDCTAAGSKVAQRLCGWLEARDLDRYIEARGRCSLCTETDQICRDIALSLWVQSASTEEEKNRWKQEYVSVTNPDGHCGNKPAIRRAIAALCAFDGQIFGKILTAFVSQKHDVDLTIDSQAAEWFEQKVPHGETWVPQLLVVFDMLVTAFDLYVPGPRQSDRPAGQNNTDSSNHAKGQPYLRIISRNALRFLFLTNHRLAFSPHIFPDKYALRFSYRTNVGKSGDPPSLQDSDC